MKATVLCYNIKNTSKGRTIARIFGFLGYRVRHVEPPEYGVTLEMLAEGKAPEEMKNYTGEGFSEEMLVMHATSEQQMDKALFLMRQEKVQIGLKAMMTPTNLTWTSMELYDEIKKEHEYMKEKERERKE